MKDIEGVSWNVSAMHSVLEEHWGAIREKGRSNLLQALRNLETTVLETNNLIAYKLSKYDSKGKLKADQTQWFLAESKIHEVNVRLSRGLATLERALNMIVL